MTAIEKHIQTFFTITLLILLGFSLLLVSCKKEQPVREPTPSEKVENKINDALDRRPGEKALDEAEKAAEKARETSVSVQEATK